MPSPFCTFSFREKTKVVHKKLLHMLREVVGEDLQNSLIFDFEASMINAHCEVLLECVSVRCFLHFTKSILRKVESLGHRVKYDEDMDFRRRVVA